MVLHQTASHPSDLLPWYVNGTLDDAGRKRIEAHLSGCAPCREKMKAIKRLRTCVKDIESQGQSPGELGLARLKRRIRSEAAMLTPRVRHRWLMPALAAAAIVIVAQAGLMLNMNSTNRQGMQLMSAPAAGDIQVRFAPDARAGQIESLLQSIHGHIVAGPGALGVYHIRISAGDSGKKDVEAAVQRLRAQNNVVQFVAREGK